MTKYEFLSIVVKLDRDDYVKAGIVAYKLDDGMLKVTMKKNDGDFFMVYLVNNYLKDIECIGTTTSYDEAKHLAYSLTRWMVEADIVEDGWDS